MIKISNLNKYFNKGKSNEIHVINDVNLQLPEKGMVAIFGKSGCGKTTLLNVIGGLDNFESGSLLIEEQSINGDVARNKYIGYIFQNYNLHAEQTCFENVANALRLCGMNNSEEIEKRVIAALKNVDMEKYKNRTPDTLSGGQQQRIAIARAIVKNPRIILADEPTGNLDEANTVMVMDLLKKISKDHLVLVVTHEANLVDYYCDKIIELSDGKVISERLNSGANGFAAKDKNDIYLGEFEKTELLSEGANVEIYGEKPQIPINIKIVNSGGKLYLQVNTPKVQILDEFSEVKLKEGVYETLPEQNSVSSEIDMSELPPIEGNNYGKLFTLKSAVVSGYKANFAHKKKGKKFLTVVMCSFAAIFVLMATIFGTVFGYVEDAEKFNQNAFYVNVNYLNAQSLPDGATLESYVYDEASAIDFVSVDLSNNAFPQGAEWLWFSAGYFETYNRVSLSSQALYLDETVCADLPVVEGKNTNLAANEAVITTAVADDLLQTSTVGYVDKYDDLIGLKSQYLELGNYNPTTIKIAGIVQSSEYSIYFDDKTFAQHILENGTFVAVAEDYSLSAQSGEAVLAINDVYGFDSSYPKVGEKVKIRGKEFTVINVIKATESQNDNPIFNKIKNAGYFVCEKDYITLSKCVGETHPTAYDYDYTDYVVLHSNNVSKTQSFLKEKFGDYYDDAITDASDILSENVEYLNEQIIIYGVSLVVVLGILSVCMYFIMRSSLLSRIKEIGVYRAIGVSKKNLLFRFLVEALVLTTLTVFISYLVVSLGIVACFGVSSMVAEVLYYPLWFALAILGLLYGICLICGILPIITLLSKTPSQILAKYDI